MNSQTLSRHRNHTFHDCLSSVTGASFKTEPKPISLSLPSDATLHETLLPSAHPATHPPAHPHTQLDLSAATLPYSGGVTDVSGPLSIPSYPPHVKKQLSLSTRPATVADTSSGNAKSFHTPVFENASFLAAENSSPCAVRDVSALRPTFVDTLPRTGITKARKTTRKPKTYSKPVASRFCHICSRMPRRGQGSATCRRMAEGFCRKIVCEQCLREQGWNYEDIAKNPGAWLCPHCADICPPRSQCHIYNRINARRKRAGTSKNGGTSVAAALASSDLLLGPYGHLFNGASQGAHILQPPPNFRLNLPPQYSQQ